MLAHYNRKFRFGQQIFFFFPHFFSGLIVRNRQIRAGVGAAELFQYPVKLVRIHFVGGGLEVVLGRQRAAGNGDNGQLTQGDLTLGGTDDLLLQNGGIQILPWIQVPLC